MVRPQQSVLQSPDLQATDLGICICRAPIQLYEKVVEHTWAAIELYPHTNVSLPRHWLNPDIPCCDWSIQLVVYDCLSVSISIEYLTTNNM